MNYYDALYGAADNAGVGISKIGELLGKTRGYIPNARARGSMPSVTNAAAQLGVCGYVLAAIPAKSVPDDALVIDAPEVTDADIEAAKQRKRAALLRQLDALDSGALIG